MVAESKNQRDRLFATVIYILEHCYADQSLTKTLKVRNILYAFRFVYKIIIIDQANRFFDNFVDFIL